MRCRLCRYIWGINEMPRLCRYIWGINEMWGCVGIYGGINDRLCSQYIRNINQQLLDRCVYCAGVNWPPNHPGGVALIKGKNKRRGCEPMRKH